MSDQPTAAEQPPSGKDLPDKPGVWDHESCDKYPNHWKLIVRTGGKNLFYAGWCGAVTVYGNVLDLPRGNWFPAVPQEANDQGTVEEANRRHAVCIAKLKEAEAALTQERHQAEVYRRHIADWKHASGCQTPEDLTARINAIDAQLTAANSRLAKARKALTRLAKWAEPSQFAEAILAEAQAALAEGEG